MDTWFIDHRGIVQLAGKASPQQARAVARGGNGANRMSAPLNNRNASKPAPQRARAWVALRVTVAEKNAWKLRARTFGLTLAKYIRARLNAAPQD